MRVQKFLILFFLMVIYHTGKAQVDTSAVNLSHHFPSFNSSQDSLVFVELEMHTYNLTIDLSKIQNSDKVRIELVEENAFEPSLKLSYSIQELYNISVNGNLVEIDLGLYHNNSNLKVNIVFETSNGILVGIVTKQI